MSKNKGYIIAEKVLHPRFNSDCMKSSIIILTVMAFGFLNVGCAITYIDKKGATNIIGLAKVKISQRRQGQKFAGDSVEVSSLGVTIHVTPISRMLGVGFSHASFTAINDDAASFQSTFVSSSSANNSAQEPRRSKNDH